jgi:hypothetical protein
MDTEVTVTITRNYAYASWLEVWYEGEVIAHGSRSQGILNQLTPLTKVTHVHDTVFGRRYVRDPKGVIHALDGDISGWRLDESVKESLK